MTKARALPGGNTCGAGPGAQGWGAPGTHLIELLLLLLQVGDDLALVVQVHQQVIELLLQAVLGLLQFVVGQGLLLQALAQCFHVFKELLLGFFQTFNCPQVIIYFLLGICQLKEKRSLLKNSTGFHT